MMPLRLSAFVRRSTLLGVLSKASKRTHTYMSKNITLRIIYPEGKTRVSVAIGGTVASLRDAIDSALPSCGRRAECSLEAAFPAGSNLFAPDLLASPIKDLGLKKGHKLYVRFLGEMSASAKRDIKEKRRKEEIARVSSFDVVGANQTDFPAFGRKYVYKERQVGKMCGQHALNALLQGPYEREARLEDAAKDLERKFKATGASMGAVGGSPYRDSRGNYSIEVLKEVLKASHGLQLASLDHPSMRDIKRFPRNADGFLLHKSDHWLAIRRVHKTYFLLDSTRKTPESLPDRLIGDVILALGGQGYTAFVVCGGSLPEPRPTRTHAKCFFDVERLLYDETLPSAKKNRWLQIEGAAGRGGGDGRRSGGLPSAATPTPSTAAPVQQLMRMGMGWTRAQCERALSQTRGDANAAVNLLLSGGSGSG